MSKVWVLRTETKGTGASVVPLESATGRDPVAEPVRVPRKPRPPAKPAPEPRAPHRFRIIDVMTRQTLADDAGVRETAEILKGVRSLVDVSVYVWQETLERWQLVPFSDVEAIRALVD